MGNSVGWQDWDTLPICASATTLDVQECRPKTTLDDPEVGLFSGEGVRLHQHWDQTRLDGCLGSLSVISDGCAVLRHAGRLLSR